MKSPMLYHINDSMTNHIMEDKMTETNPPEPIITFSEDNTKYDYVKIVNEHICLIAMPNEIVHSILYAVGGIIADPSIFGKELREEVHRKLNEVILKIAPVYCFIDKIKQPELQNDQLNDR